MSFACYDCAHYNRDDKMCCRNTPVVFQEQIGVDGYGNISYDYVTVFPPMGVDDLCSKFVERGDL